jgi:putative colanic acid biosynthesis acetyltransferase WcaF
MSDLRVDLSRWGSPHSFRNKIARTVWGTVWLLLFRTSPRVCYTWRSVLLRLFGAEIGKGVRVSPSTKIGMPWRLKIGDWCAIGPGVDCDNDGGVTIGDHTIISQYSYLCSATRDYTRTNLPHTPSPIHVGDQVWICADVFVGPGVTIGQGAVVGARSSVFKNVPPWSIVVGSPARFLKKRELSAQ